MNLPNKLTVLRICLIPVLLVFLLFPILPETPSRILALVIFAVASYTDHLDGKTARQYNLVTDFGKFLDPVADKLLVIGALLGLLVLNAPNVMLNRVTACVTFIVLLRELAITSIRMVISDKKSAVMPANWLGKVKTVTQIVCVIVMLAEPLLTKGTPLDGLFVFSYITLAAMGIMTLWSGLNYLKVYFPLLDPKR